MSAAKMAGRGRSRALLLSLLCVVVLVVVANFLWLGKHTAEQKLEEMKKKVAEANSKAKEFKEKLSAASTQQEAEHAQVSGLQAKIQELEQSLAAEKKVKTSFGVKGLGAKGSRGKAHPPNPQPPALNAPPPESVQSHPPDLPPARSSKPETLSVQAPSAQPALPPPPPKGSGGLVVPIVILACCRPRYLERTLDIVLERIPKDGPHTFEVWVSQDGEHQGVKTLVSTKYPSVHYIQHINHGPLKKASPHEQDSYYKIAQHYGFCFNEVFKDPRFEYAIVLEDDLEIAPDFLDYMTASYEVIKKDPSLWLATAWNDNGLPNYSKDPAKIYRSDFFGGLGWLLTRRLWDELGPKWPKGYWDDWMREPAQRQGRACLRPEISRTITFGKEGTSQGQFFDQHLGKMVLNRDPQRFNEMDLTYLLKENYDGPFLHQVDQATELKGSLNTPLSGDSKVIYHSYETFKRLAMQLNIMSDEKAGVPRTAYLGVVTINKDGHSLYVAPKQGKPYYTQVPEAKL